MLEIGRTRLVSVPRSSSPAAFVPRPAIDAFQLDALARRFGLIAVTALVFAALGLAFAALRPETYTATTQLILDNRELQLNQQDTMVASVALDNPMVLSQIEILRSEHTGTRVARALNLSQRPEFQSEKSWLSSVRDLFGSGEARPVDQAAVDRGIAGRLRSDLLVERLGGSYLVNVSYTSANPELAANIVNTIARVYLEDQAAANRRAAQSATAWLRERMQALGPNARIVSEAAPPASTDGPGLIAIVGAALVLGTIVGLGLALVREIFDDRIRSPEDLARVTDAEFLGSLPMVRRRRRAPIVATASRDGKKRGAKAEIVDLPWAFDNEDPTFVATLRRVSVASLSGDSAHGSRVLGVSSIAKGDGKTMVAANIARIIATSGRRVLLIDCNLQNSTLSRLLAPGASFGLAEALDGRIAWTQAVWADDGTRLHFLPAAAEEAAGRGTEAIWLGSIQRLLEEAQGAYDQIVIDLPAMMPAPDVRAAARLLDGIVLVVSYETTPVRQAHQALRAAGPAEGKVIGVLLNKTRRSLPQSLAYRLLGLLGWRATNAV